MRDLLTQCSLRHPSISLNALQVSTNNLKAKLLGAARTSSLPEIFALNSAWAAEPHILEHLADLSPLLKSAGIDPSKLYRPWDLERCKQGSSMHCLPAYSASGTSMLFINNELLGRHGIQHSARIQNWKDFTEISRDYVSRMNPGRDLDFIALDPFMGPGMVIHSSLCFGIGSPTISEDGRQSQLATPSALSVARALDDYVERVYGTYGGYRALLDWRFRYAGLHRQPAFSSLPYDRQCFAIAAAGSLARYRRVIPIRQLLVQPVPGLQRLHGGIASHSWAYALSHDAAARADAWSILRFLTIEEEGLGRFCRTYGRPSPLQVGGDDAEYYQDWGQAWDGVKEAAALDVPYPASSEDEFLRYHIYMVPMRRLRGESIDLIFSDMDAQYQAYLDQGNAS